jgi:hypothetical protein
MRLPSNCRPIKLDAGEMIATIAAPDGNVMMLDKVGTVRPRVLA